MLEAKSLTLRYGRHTVLQSIDLQAYQGEILALIGPNGSGKTTLLKSLSGQLVPAEGKVLLDGQDLSTWKKREIARKIAFLPQERSVPRMTVRRLVLHGRFPYLNYPRNYSGEDLAIAEEAMRSVGVEVNADAYLQELSGGQRQAAYLAMALAQQTSILLLDEPTAWLDSRRRYALMTLLRRLAHQGKTVLVVLHDLSLALETADRVAALSGGILAGLGTPESIRHSGIPEEIFGVHIRPCPGEDAGHYYLVPCGEAIL